MKPWRVVLDTNLLVSYLLTQGKTMTQIIDYWENSEIIPIVSTAIVEELIEVVHRPRLRRQMVVDPQILIDFINSDTIRIDGELSLAGASRDPKDDKFLACAVEGAAEYIVSGDEDLLSLRNFRGIAIVRPADFVPLLEAAKRERDGEAE